LNTSLAYLRKGSGILMILIGLFFIWNTN